MRQKQFKVAAKSSNTGSFGHTGYVLVAQDGEAWEVGRIDGGGKPVWEVGTVISVRIGPGGNPTFVDHGCEIPKPLAHAPDNIVRQLWGKRKPEPKPIIELEPNGDPFGHGFVGSQSDDGGESWFYRGDIGPQTRAWWRSYAQRHGYKLREYRG